MWTLILHLALVTPLLPVLYSGLLFSLYLPPLASLPPSIALTHSYILGPQICVSSPALST